MRSTSLITEVKQQWAKLELGRVTVLSFRPGIGCILLGSWFLSLDFHKFLSALLVSLMALRLAHVDQNTLWPCFLQELFSCPVADSIV